MSAGTELKKKGKNDPPQAKASHCWRKESEDGRSETESDDNNTSKADTKSPKGMPKAKNKAVAIAETRFLSLRSDQYHRQRPWRPTPFSRVLLMISSIF